MSTHLILKRLCSEPQSGNYPAGLHVYRDILDILQLI